jgi:opacity protein-like surface antigen
MKKLLVAGIAAAALYSVPTLAADYPARAAPAPVFNWSGFYLGFQGGWQGSKIKLDDPVNDPTGVFGISPKHDSVALGALLGYQQQWGQLVLGVEGDYIHGFNQSKFVNTQAPGIFFPGGSGQAEARMVDIVSAGGRIGWAMGTWMPYATGGFAHGHFNFDAHATGASVGQLAKAEPNGFYVGGGVDMIVAGNLIFGIDYRHYDFSGKTVNSFTPVSTFVEPVRFKPKTDAVMARVTVKFGG